MGQIVGHDSERGRYAVLYWVDGASQTALFHEDNLVLVNNDDFPHVVLNEYDDGGSESE